MLAMVVAEMLVLRVVIEETVEEKKGDKEKEAVEGGDKVEAEKDVEEKEEDQGYDDALDPDVDLPDPDCASHSG